MARFSQEVKKLFNTILEEMALDRKNFVISPEKDFTRHGKERFVEYMLYLCTMSGRTYATESLDFFNYSVDHFSPSAICQARQKIKYNAFEYLFNEFTSRCEAKKSFKGFKLYAVDGTVVPTFRNPNDKSGTYIKNSHNKTGYNCLHLNAIYDLCNKTYVDAVIQPRSKKNEHKALYQMIDNKNQNKKIIYVCDRGYESYNTLAHIKESGNYYLIRGRDVTSNGIASKYKMPSMETFDSSISINLTRSKGKKYKENPEKYRILSGEANFDFVNLEKKIYHTNIRVVRIKLESGKHEILLTNLDKNDFSPKELKKIYNDRWGIETSFRELKYTVGATYFNSKKMDLIKQEIYASLMIYNFTSLIVNKTRINKNKFQKKKHVYRINFSVAVSVCRKLMRSLAYVSPPEDVEAILQRHHEAIREGRTYNRMLRNRRVWNCFQYRVA